MLLWAVSVPAASACKMWDVRCSHSGRRLNCFGSLFEWYRMSRGIFTMWMDIGIWALTRNRFHFLFIFILWQLITHKSTYVYSLLLNRIESLWASQQPHKMRTQQAMRSKSAKLFTDANDWYRCQRRWADNIKSHLTFGHNSQNGFTGRMHECTMYIEQCVTTSASFIKMFSPMLFSLRNHKLFIAAEKFH